MVNLPKKNASSLNKIDDIILKKESKKQISKNSNEELEEEDEQELETVAGYEWNDELSEHAN